MSKLAVYDFDQTLMDTPTPDNGPRIWEEKTGKEWPHKGWWGRSETLDTNVFDIQPIKKVADFQRSDHKDPNVVTVMMTGRHEGLRDEVTSLLNEFGIKFDHYLLKTKHPTIEFKKEQLNDLAQKYPDVTTIDIWEDRPEHVKEFRNWGENIDADVNVIHVGESGEQ